jgi:hypothetical protein
MKKNWIFENGQLIARNNDNELIVAWSADEGLGRPLADFLNLDTNLGELLCPQENNKIESD